MRIVYVRWEDSNSFAGWRDIKSMMGVLEVETMVCESVGIVLFDHEDRLALTHSYSLAGGDKEVHEISSVMDCLLIPRSCILEVSDLYMDDRRIP